MPKNVMMSDGRMLSPEEAATHMKMTKAEFETAGLIADAVAHAIHAAPLSAATAVLLSLSMDKLLNDALKARKVPVEMPVEIVMKEFNIPKEQALIVTYFADATTDALAQAVHTGLLTREVARSIALDMATRTRAAFAHAALDTIGEVMGHA